MTRESRNDASRNDASRNDASRNDASRNDASRNDASPTLRRALFLDRDGTIITDEHFLNDATRVRLMPGAAASIARVNALGILVVIITNQSGIGRGIIKQPQYEAVAARVHELLREESAHVDATYYCPDLPDVPDDISCRKPGTLMYQMAAAELGIDLARSAYIGDKWRDVHPALALGGFGVLVPNGGTDAADIDRALLSANTAADIEQAVTQALVWMRVVE